MLLSVARALPRRRFCAVRPRARALVYCGVYCAVGLVWDRPAPLQAWLSSLYVGCMLCCTSRMLYAYGYMCHERCSVAVSNARRQGYRATTTTDVVRHAGLRTELGLGGALGAEGDGQRHASLTDSRCGVADPFCEGVCAHQRMCCAAVLVYCWSRGRAHRLPWLFVSDSTALGLARPLCMRCRCC